MTYDYQRAEALDNKARTLLARHRSHVFGAKADGHIRAIRRIQKLMAPAWRERSNYLRGMRALSTWA